MTNVISISLSEESEPIVKELQDKRENVSAIVCALLVGAYAKKITKNGKKGIE